MKTLLQGFVALAALAAVPAAAADMPVKALPPAVAVYSWTGCFIGGHAGPVTVRKDYTYTGLDAGNHGTIRVLAGGQAGCDYQFAGGWVVGIQGDYAGMRGSAEHASFFPGIPGVGFGPPLAQAGNVVHASDARSLASVTGRLGYAVDRALLYVRGGVAWERDNYSVTFPFLPATALNLPIAGFTAEASETRRGWTVGAGGEVAFTNFVSGFIELDYYGFGTRTITFVNPNTLAQIPFDIRERKFVAKLGLNLRFGGVGAVVAKY